MSVKAIVLDTHRFTRLIGTGSQLARCHSHRRFIALGIQYVVVSVTSVSASAYVLSRARIRVDHDRLKERIRIVLAAALTKRTINESYLLPA